MPDHKPSKDNALPHSGMFRAADVAASPALRERAQREVRAQTLRVPEDFSGLSPEAGQTLLHELRVHQIELELQNDELLRTQYDLEASRARYFDLYDVAPVGYLTLAENGLVLEANLTAAGLLERTRDAIVNQPFTRFILPEDQDIYYHHNKQLSRSGMPQVCELRLLKSSGVSFWGQLEARIAHDVEGRPASRTVLSEITERRRAEQTLRLSEARHRTLFENSADALVTLGPPGWHFTSANAAAIAMFGAEAEADFVERAPSYYSPERQPDGRPSAEKAAAMIEIAMRTGSHTFEWTHRRLPADEFCATVTLVRMEANGAPLLQATVRDDSEERRKRAILAQTERLASMGMLAASVGHEINNPLAYVLSNVESLAKTLPEAAGAAERFRVSLQSAVGDDALAAMLGADSALLEPAMLKEASDQARDALDGVQRITRISKVLSAFARTDTPELSEVDVKHAIELAVSMASNQLEP